MNGHSATRRRMAVAIIGSLACAHALPADAAVIHRERSLYQTILVDKTGPRVCLKFSVRRQQLNQSCIDQGRPREMVFLYTRMMMAALLLNPAPRRVLVAGLGGGTVPAAISQLYPDAIVDVVEIDGAVVDVARRFFGFVESERLRVHVQDARTFIRRAVRNGETYDLVMLDAYNSEYIPEHLMTREFLADAKTLLSEDGALAANTFASSRLYDHESTTYSAVFGPFFNLRLPDSANRVILVTKQPLPDLVTLHRRATALRTRLRPYGIDIKRYPKELLSEVDWDTGARVLTDQYSPANLLRDR